jgi:hypothetical protein
LPLVGVLKILVFPNFDGTVRGIRYGNGSLLATVRPHKSLYRVGLGGSTASAIMSRLYNGAPMALERKVNAARNILPLGHQTLAEGSSSLSVS